MATFTIELSHVLDLYPEGETPTYANIGLDDYPLFDESYRAELNQKIVNHYHNREIGQETVSMWRFAMRRKMHEIMPTYNQLYLSTQMEFDPFVTVDIKTISTAESTQAATAEGNSETETSGESGSRAVQSQTPHMLLQGNKDYATSAADTNSDSKNESVGKESSVSNTEDTNNSESSTKGYQAMPADLLMAYRATILNIDLMIITELAELFMGMWNNGDEYTRRKGMYYR